MAHKFGLCTYRSPDGSSHAGFVVDGMVYDAALFITHEPTSPAPTVLSLLADWSSTREMMHKLKESMSSLAPLGVPVTQVVFEAPVQFPGAVYCAGANYRDHIAEMARAMGDTAPLDPREQGNLPWHFVKPSRGCVVGEGARVPRPPGCTSLDWEVELAVVIGLPARHVSVATALEHVAGYAVAIDLSARDLSRRQLVAKTSPFHFDWLAHKGFEGSCPLGPYLTPAVNVPNPQNLSIQLAINGTLRQDSRTSEMIFSVAEQIAHISRFMTLHPGDVILTGTPAGVGAATGTFLQPGDVLQASIGGLGTLTTTIA